MDSPATLVFDGDCGFCTSSAHWIERRWRSGQATAIPWQRLSANQLEGFGLSRDDVASRVWWVDQRGAVGGERAIAAALIGAGGVWRLIGRVMDVPPLLWLARPRYRMMARHRHRLPGGTPACRL